MQCRLVCGREDGSIIMVPATQTIMLHLLSGRHQKFTNWPQHQVERPNLRSETKNTFVYLSSRDRESCSMKICFPIFLLLLFRCKANELPSTLSLTIFVDLCFSCFWVMPDASIVFSTLTTSIPGTMWLTWFPVP